MLTVVTASKEDNRDNFAVLEHCFGHSAATRIRQFLCATRTLLPLRETLRLPSFALVYKLGATSELELLSASRQGLHP